MSHQPPHFYSTASTPRVTKQTTRRSRSTPGSGPRHPLRALNFEYQPGMYLPDDTVDDFNMDSTMSDSLGGDFNENGDREPHITTPTQSRQTLGGEYSDRSTRYTTPIHPSHLPGRTATHSVEEMISLLQGQQGVLNQLLQGQRDLREKHEILEKRFTELENQQASPSLSSSGSDKERGKRNRIVTSELSAKVSKLYSALETKYDPSERLMSSANQQVLSKIVSEIVQQPGCKYEEKVVTSAAKRCYENQRRLFLEQQAGKENYTEEQAKKRKYRSRRERKFKRRTNVVTANEMDKYWKHLSIQYMTEESDDSENPNGIVEHKIRWRSNRLNEFIQALDSRVDKATVPNPGLVAKKVRKVGDPSSASPPTDAPVWAVRPELQRTAHNATANADIGTNTSQLDQPINTETADTSD